MIHERDSIIVYNNTVCVIEYDYNYYYNKYNTIIYYGTYTTKRKIIFGKNVISSYLFIIIYLSYMDMKISIHTLIHYTYIMQNLRIY